MSDHRSKISSLKYISKDFVIDNFMEILLEDAPIQIDFPYKIRNNLKLSSKIYQEILLSCHEMRHDSCCTGLLFCLTEADNYNYEDLITISFDKNCVKPLENVLKKKSF